MTKKIISIVLLLLCVSVLVAAQDKPKSEPKEVILTDAQSLQIELALQREWNAAKDLELLKRQFNDLQEKFPVLQKATKEVIEAACKEAGVDPKTYAVSNDFKKLVPRPKQ